TLLYIGVAARDVIMRDARDLDHREHLLPRSPSENKGPDAPRIIATTEEHMHFVHANFAARADESGEMRYDHGSSCAADLRRVHLLRETYPAIAVGRRTVQLDQPRLTARREHLGRPPLSQPTRIVLTRSTQFEPPAGFQKITCP